jgi:CheY-like chemotaxis protein
MSKILIADDDEDVLECLALVLGESHEIVAVANGEDALAKATTVPFDLIVLDLMMPLASGGDVVRQLKAAGIATPILLASAAEDLPRRADELHVTAHIAKPYDFGMLERKISECLESSPARSAV